MRMHPIGRPVLCLLLLASCSAWADTNCGWFIGGMPEPVTIPTPVSYDILAGNIARHGLEEHLRDPAYPYRQETDLLRRIGATLDPYLPPYARQFHYDVYVTDRFEAGGYASSVDGGVIVVAIEAIIDSESVSTLAYIYAHEVGHVALRHTAVREQKQIAATAAYVRAVRSQQHINRHERAQQDVWRRQLLEDALMGYSIQRMHEREADLFAAYVASSAGYDALPAVHFLERLGGDPDHPRGSERAALLRCMFAGTTTSHQDLEQEFRTLQLRLRAVSRNAGHW